jgi:uncharacterized protein (TIGR03083 family)
VDIGSAYKDGRERLLAIAAGCGPDDAARPVPACPAWTVKDVYAHLSGVVADALAGRLDGVATDPWTAKQVSDRADQSLADVCSEWAANAPLFESFLGEDADPRIIIDEWTHEQDVRGALARPGARDGAVPEFVVGRSLEFVAQRWGEERLPPVRVVTPSIERSLGEGDVVATLRVGDFELARVLLGRRSVEQVAALDWDGDPRPALPHFRIFGPAAASVVE